VIFRVGSPFEVGSHAHVGRWEFASVRNFYLKSIFTVVTILNGFKSQRGGQQLVGGIMC